MTRRIISPKLSRECDTRVLAQMSDTEIVRRLRRIDFGQLENFARIQREAARRGERVALFAFRGEWQARTFFYRTRRELIRDVAHWARSEVLRRGQRYEPLAKDQHER